MQQEEDLFDVKLKKGESYGFNFKKPQAQGNVNARGFLLVAVIPGASLAQYNSAQAVEGRWDRIVLPGMRIRAINGIENPLGAMLQELKDKDEVTLRVESNKKLRASAVSTTPQQYPAQGLSSEQEEMFRDRVNMLLGQYKDSLQRPATSDEEWKTLSSHVGEHLVKELFDIAGHQLCIQMQSLEQPASVPASTLNARDLGVTYPGDMDDEVLSEESV